VSSFVHNNNNQEYAMNVSYIEEIYNNTNHAFVMWSTDSEHNGVFDDFDTGIRVGDNDWGHVLVIRPGARLKASWCGIPWYKDGKCYRVIAKGDKQERHGLRMFQAETDLGDGIHFIDHRTGNPLGDGGPQAGVVPFPGVADRQFALTINENNGELEFKLWNRQTKTGKQEFIKALGKFARDYYEDHRKIRIEMAKAVAGAVARGSK
jgi:hypothetical protein